MTGIRCITHVACPTAQSLHLSHLQHDLALVLWYVSMKHVCFNAEGMADSQLVCVTLGLTEDHGAALGTAVHSQDVPYSGRTVLVAALDGQVLHHTHTHQGSVFQMFLEN